MKELAYRPPTTSYVSVWNTAEQQESQYSPALSKYNSFLLETPMMSWKADQAESMLLRHFTHLRCLLAIL
ncbi:MAG: hypothetical protein ACKPKO_34870, partial [Candidatus Fonsibacter sp.]